MSGARPATARQPYKTDNALVKAAEVVQRIAEYQPRTEIHDIWRRFVEGMDFPDELVGPLLDPDSVPRGVRCPARSAWPGSPTPARTPPSRPTIAHGGTKINVIPDRVDLQIDIRTLPGHGEAEVRAMLDEALGDLAPKVELVGVPRRPVHCVAHRHAAVGLARARDRSRSTRARRSCRS